MAEYASTRAEAKKRGDKDYYTGKPCKNGHDAVRSVSEKKCYECKREGGRRRYKANPERANENSRRWREANPERTRENNRRWREANPERARELPRQWRVANSEHLREKARQRYWANPEKHREKVRQRQQDNPEQKRKSVRCWQEANRERTRKNARRWGKANPERRRAIKHTRRSRKNGNGEPITTAEHREWEAAQPKVCEYCNADCSDEYHVDHIQPLSKGGPHQVHNLAIACPSCNCRKSDRDPDEFLEELLAK